MLVDDGGALAHEEGTELVENVVIVAVAALLHDLIEVGLVGNGALGGELLHLGLAVDLPVVNVLVVTDAHGAAGEDDGADVVVVAGSLDGLLVGLGGTGLVGEDEAGADPDGAGAHHERGGEELAVVDATSGDDLDRSAGQGGLVLLADLNNGGDEDSGGDIASVAAALTTLSDDDVDAEVEALLNVLDVANHVHVDDAVGVQLVDDGLGGDANGRDEDLGALLDDDVDELIELALCVVVAVVERVSREWS